MRKIKNPQVNILKTNEMNDKDYLNVLLEIEKNLSNNISTALNEVSCEKIFNLEFIMFTEIKGLVRDLFEMLFASGWYDIEIEDKEKMQESLNEFETNLNQLI